MDFRKARKNEVLILANLMSHSFEEYPTFQIPFEGKFSSKEEYRAFVQRLNTIEIRAFLKQKSVFVLSDHGEIIALALLESPNFKKSSLVDYLFNGGLSVVHGFWRHGLGQFMKLMGETEHECQLRRKKGSWYLKALAVSKHRQGQRIGSRFIENYIVPHLKANDGKELCLITNTKRNAQFYKKNHFQEFAFKTSFIQHKEINTWNFIYPLTS